MSITCLIHVCKWIEVFQEINEQIVAGVLYMCVSGLKCVVVSVLELVGTCLIHVCKWIEVPATTLPFCVTETSYTCV